MTTDDGARRLGFVGAGAMGGAIACGLIDAGAVRPGLVGIADLARQVREGFVARGASAFPGAQALLDAFDPEVVFLAVKPQALPQVASDMAHGLRGRLVVSIAAGVGISTLEGLMPGVRVVRCMPNLPMAAGSGAVAMTPGTHATHDDAEFVRGLLSHLAIVETMSEAQLDAAGVVCGCSPAFFALFVDCLTRAGIEAGLPAHACRPMVEATMRGTAEQLLASSDHPRSYMERVSSPGGTTIAALRALEGPLFDAVADAVDVALARTASLGGSRPAREEASGR